MSRRPIFIVTTIIMLLSLLFTACADGGGNADPTQEASLSSSLPTEPIGIPTIAPTGLPAEAPTELPAIDYWPCYTMDEYPVVNGSTANIPMAEALIALLTGCTGAEAEASINFSGTDYAYQELSQGNADMLLVYEPSDSTKEELKTDEAMDMRPIGYDALVFIVNEDNPVESLTVEQLQGIYSGEITNWSEVGGLDIEIVPFQRPYLSGSQTLMLNLCMQDVEMIEAEEERVCDSMGDIINAIASYNNSANAIGYSVYYYAKNMFTRPGLKFIPAEGVMPSNESINSTEYPFINPFYAVLPSVDPNPYAQAIVNWLETEVGQRFVESCGYVPYMILPKE